MAQQTVFDSPNTIRFNQARRNLLAELLPVWQRELGLKTAMDVGCGMGYFSALLVELGLETRAPIMPRRRGAGCRDLRFK